MILSHSKETISIRRSPYEALGTKMYMYAFSKLITFIYFLYGSYLLHHVESRTQDTSRYVVISNSLSYNTCLSFLITDPY